MPYKNYENTKSKALEYYYKNKKEVLRKQNKRVMEKYHSNPEFKKIYNIRKATSHKYPLTKEKCIICKTNKDLQRHHLKYTIKREDFIVLCRKHHTQLHRNDLSQTKQLAFDRV